MQLTEIAVESTMKWQRRAIEAYEHAIPAQRDALEGTLASQLSALLGNRLRPDHITTDSTGSFATVRIDDRLFRQYRHGLVLVRPCAGCPGGFDESPVIDTQADLGFALAVWYPAQEGMHDDPSADLADM